MSKYLCICLSSTIQKSVMFDDVQLESVNRSNFYRLDASGKGLNSARVLNHLEEKLNNKKATTVICPIGKKNKSLFFELSKRDNLKIKSVLIPGFTRECLTLLGEKNHNTTEIVVGEPSVENKFDFSKSEKKILSLVKKSLKKVDGVLFAGSRPNCWCENLIPQIAKLAHENNKIFLADFHGKDLLLTLEKSIPTIIKINSDEFCSTFNLEKNISENELKQKIINFSVQYKNIFVVTRGTKSTFAADNGNFIETQIEKIVPLNTTACGDSFSAGFLFEYVKSRNLEKSLKKGTECATLNAKNLAPGYIL